jgi:hypothetical protein
MRIYIEVEDSDNTYSVPLRVFSTLADAYLVSKVKMDTRAGVGIRHWVTGWSSEGDGSPCPVFCVPVEDSGDAVSYLVHGGDWGLRFRPLEPDAGWDTANEDQFGEPYLLLAAESDVIPA